MVRMWDRAGLWLGGHRTAATGKKVKTPGWGWARRHTGGSRHQTHTSLHHRLHAVQIRGRDWGHEQLARGIIGVTISTEADTKIHPVAIAST